MSWNREGSWSPWLLVRCFHRFSSCLPLLLEPLVRWSLVCQSLAGLVLPCWRQAGTESLAVAHVRAGSIKAASDLVSGEDPFPQQRQLSSFCVFTWQKKRASFSYKGINPINEGSTYMTHSPPEGFIAKYNHIGGWVSICEFGGTQTFHL